MSGKVERRVVNEGRVVLEDVPEIPGHIAERLSPFHHIRNAVLEELSEDGESIYITTRFATTQQLHHVHQPGGARRQLTFRSEPVQEVRRRPGRETLFFLADEGGNEKFQIHAFEPGSAQTRRLTHEGRQGSMAWRPDGDLLAFRSTRRDGRSSDVWIMDPERPDEAELLLEAPNSSFWVPAIWSPDGKRLALMEYAAATHSSTYVLDVETRDLRRVAGGDDGIFMPLDFSADGRFLFLASDQGGEFSQLARIPADGGELTWITDDLPWNLTSFARGGSKAAFVINEQGYGHIYLLDMETLAYRRLEGLPKGLAGRLRFTEDGRRMAFNVDTSTSPAEVWTVDLGDQPLEHEAPRRWTFSEVGGLPESSFVEPELIHYPTFDEDPGTDKPRLIPAFVYRPPTPGPHPVVIRIHGGPEAQFRPGFNGSVQSWVGGWNIAVIAPNVRGSSGYGKTFLKIDNGMLREDSVRDIGALLDWIAEQDDLDASRVAVYGGSYGGYMVLASLVHYSDRLRAGVDLVGISNFVTFLENTKSYRRDLRRVEYGDERDPEMRAFLDRISPNRNAEKIQAPLFVAQGHNDPRVPYTEAEQIVADVRKAGKTVWYFDALDEGHGFRKKDNRDLFEQAAMAFFERHLLPESPE